jgi:NAD(P)-dependent dehydrogenase (short-subunit alcohol dehydrogenase family)
MPVPAAAMSVCRFTPDDLRLFGAASHDRNPLHRDCERSRRGPFGAPIVFGGLGVLGALAALDPDPARAIEAIRAVFPQPLFVDVPYSIEVEHGDPGSVAVALTDGGRTALRVTIGSTFCEPIGPEAKVREETPRESPREWDLIGLDAGGRVAGSYGAAAKEYHALVRRFGLGQRGVSGYLLHSILFASYLVGMELPGERGLLSSLRISLPRCVPGSGGKPLRYEAAVVEKDPRLGSLTVAAEVAHSAAGLVSRVTCGVELQAKPAGLDRRRLHELLPASGRLAGKVGVVIGADGAVGSAVALGLMTQGCDVYGVVRDRLRARPSSPSVRVLAGDCGSLRSCLELRERVEGEQGGIDVLVCAAAPAIRGMRFHESSVERFLQFVEDSLRLVAVPLAAFLPALDARHGCCVLPSTMALRTMPPNWAHYVTAKTAGEVTLVAAGQSWPNVEFVVLRLPLVRTERLGSLGRQPESVPLEEVSARIVTRTISRGGPGVHLLEWDDVDADPFAIRFRSEPE